MSNLSVQYDAHLQWAFGCSLIYDNRFENLDYPLPARVTCSM